MRSRSMAVAVFVCVAGAAGASLSHLRASSLRGEADWLMARGNAEAQEYAASFDGARAEKQLNLFEQRRTVLHRATNWWLFEMMLVMVSVVAGVSSYVLYLFRRLREQLVEATSDDEHHPVAS